MPDAATQAVPRWRLSGVVVAVVVAGCATPPVYDRACVSQNVERRFDASIPETTCANQPIIPPGFDLSKPLAEDQVVLLALWNNAAFHELLTELKLTAADLIQAGLLPNPEFVYYWPVADKPLKYLIDFPVESLWLRPIRLQIAGAENARACAKLAQAALDLIRDTRQAYADAALAHERVRVAGEAVRLRGRIAELAKVRFEEGEASAQEAATARIDALQAKQDSTRIGYEVPLAEERLRNLTGLTGSSIHLVPVAAAVEALPEFETEELVTEAVAGRPDATAAAEAERAAIERVRLARLGWVRFLGLLDATSGQSTGHEFGPALRMTVPIFNRNQGGIARAEAEREQLARRRLTVHNQIVLDVRLAHARYRQARAEFDTLHGTVRPEVEATVGRAQKAYEAGNTTYLLALEAARQRIDTDYREAVLQSDLRRAWAELERSVGRRLTPTAAPKEAPR